MSRIDTLRALHDALGPYPSLRAKAGTEFFWAARNAMPDLLALAEAAKAFIDYEDNEADPDYVRTNRKFRALREALARLEGR